MKTFTYLFSVIVMFAVAVPLEASHRGSRIDRDKLDDDIVETFPIPVLFGVSHEDLVPDYGDPRGGGTRVHEGQDMRAPQGTPIVSPTDAIVIRIGTGSSAGKYVYTANPGGETFRYMHLDAVARNLDEGDLIEAGEFIGTVGDTGNAPEGVYHLHFETRDSEGANDPYPRLDDDGWSLKQKVNFLESVFRGVRNDDEYAAFLVESFRDEMIEALNEGYPLPEEVTDVLEDSGVMRTSDQLDALERALKRLPLLIRNELSLGSQSVEVTVLQLYLIYLSDGEARDRLKAAGPTGYFGAVTEAAVIEYQKANYEAATGIVDAKTRTSMAENSSATLELF